MWTCENRRTSNSARRPPFSLCCVILLIGSTTALTQTPTPKAASPRIGLVLEGGGALGLEHVGIIRWLEEHLIPVRYIAGTSMGGLVGWAYAPGKNTAEVREVVDRIDSNQ